MNSHTSTAAKLGNSFLCVFAAFIWGIAFVAQSTGGDYLGPFTFNCLRSLMGAIVLVPIVLISNKKERKAASYNANTGSYKTNRKPLIMGGIACGLLLSVATNLQQVALALGAPAGKAGFLTACYILLVPILGLFLKKRCGWHVWISVVIAVVGLYLLCINGPFALEQADLLLLICAVVFALHILVIDHFAPKVNCIAMSCIQFLVCGIITLFPTFFYEMRHSMEGVATVLAPLKTMDAWIPLLYTGVLSSGVAYTLQMIGQRRTNPTVASLLFSLESVFSVLAGWVLLHQQLQSRELLGCLLIFGAIVLAQLPLSGIISKESVI